MPQLTSYTKDTQSNILANPPTADGQIAFTTDTYQFYISEGTNWRSYQARKIYGNYDLTESVSLSSRPMYHIDASSIGTVLNGNESQPSDGDGVASITCKATGKTMISDIATEQPTYVSASGTPIMGETTGDARIGGLNTMQFDGSQMLAYDYSGQNSFHRSAGWTGIAVIRFELDSGNSSGWAPVFGSANTGASFTYRDNYSYAYFNYRYGNSGTSINLTASTLGATASFDQTGNYPLILVVRLGLNKSNYVTSTDWNINNNQFFHTWSTTNFASENAYHGMMLGANYAYKSTTQRFHGEIGEFLFFDSMLNNNSVNKVTNYLAAKWSLNWSNI
ncbi:MAG: hypothetical protein CL833_02805 [Crocinitomicaceae bacterium]|nr:hypothetical protein [Crocinitomicaceae bacterium]